MTNLTPAQAKAIKLIKQQYKDAKEFNAPHDYQARRSVSRATMNSLVKKGILRVTEVRRFQINSFGMETEFSDTGRRVHVAAYAWA